MVLGCRQLAAWHHLLAIPGLLHDVKWWWAWKLKLFLDKKISSLGIHYSQATNLKSVAWSDQRGKQKICFHLLFWRFVSRERRHKIGSAKKLNGGGRKDLWWCAGDSELTGFMGEFALWVVYMGRVVSTLARVAANISSGSSFVCAPAAATIRRQG